MQDLVVVDAVLVQKAEADQLVDDRGRGSRVVEQATVLEGTDDSAVHLDDGFGRDDLKIEHHPARDERDSGPTQDAHDVLARHSSE